MDKQGHTSLIETLRNAGLPDPYIHPIPSDGEDVRSLIIETRPPRTFGILRIISNSGLLERIDRPCSRNKDSVYLRFVATTGSSWYFEDINSRNS